MDNLEKAKCLEYMLKHFEGTPIQMKMLSDMEQRVLSKVFNDICKEFNVCSICGKDLEQGKIRVRERYPSPMCREIKSLVCSDFNCQYNKDKSEELQRKEDWGGVL